MSTKMEIAPLTRIEGHLAVRTEGEPVTVKGKKGFRVTAAHCEGEMFRGFETILRGRDPLDAQQITQRICGVCPISHGMASVQAQEMAYGIDGRKRPLTTNGRLLQNLILAANYLQSHVLHFYHLSALDFVDVTAILHYKGKSRTLLHIRDWVKASLDRKDVFPAAPFLPRYDAEYVKDLEANWSLLAHYVQALEIRRVAHEAAAVFGAKVPHATALVPGGCTQIPTMERILAFRSRMQEVLAFVEDVYLPDLVAVAGIFPEYFEIGVGYPNFLSYGVFRDDNGGRKWMPAGALVDGRLAPLDPSAIREEVSHSRFSSPTGLHPSAGETVPAAHKSGAYSWLKAPRYEGRPMEVGPLARVMVGYHTPGCWIREKVDKVLETLDLPVAKLHSALGRHLARGLEAVWIGRQALAWTDQLEVDKPPARDFEIPARAEGYGLTEAPRGALGHWLRIADYKIANYQCVVPTTWNCSPRDGQGQPGAVEKCLEGVVVAKPEQPMEVGRVVRSFDPCLACAVH